MKVPGDATSPVRPFPMRAAGTVLPGGSARDDPSVRRGGGVDLPHAPPPRECGLARRGFCPMRPGTRRGGCGPAHAALPARSCRADPDVNSGTRHGGRVAVNGGRSSAARRIGRCRCAKGRATVSDGVDAPLRSGASTPATMAHRCRRGASTPSLTCDLARRNPARRGSAQCGPAQWKPAGATRSCAPASVRGHYTPAWFGPAACERRSDLA